MVLTSVFLIITFILKQMGYFYFPLRTPQGKQCWCLQHISQTMAYQNILHQLLDIWLPVIGVKWGNSEKVKSISHFYDGWHFVVAQQLIKAVFKQLWRSLLQRWWIVTFYGLEILMHSVVDVLDRQSSKVSALGPLLYSVNVQQTNPQMLLKGSTWFGL